MVVMVPVSFSQLTLGRRAEFFEQFDQRAAFSLRQAVGGTIHGVLVPCEHVRDARLSVGCEMDHTRAPVAGVRGPRHETALLEPIDRRGNRPAREIDASADLTDRLRSLVQQHFKDPEIRDAHVEGHDAPFRMADQRLMRLHEHEPDVHAGAVRRRLPHRPYYLHIKYLDVKLILSSSSAGMSSIIRGWTWRTCRGELPPWTSSAARLSFSAVRYVGF